MKKELSQLVLLARFSQKQHAVDMMKHGYLYFSSLMGFRNGEPDSIGRNDKRELNISSRPMVKASVTLPDGKSFEFIAANGPFRLREYLNDPSILCFSMTQITFPLDEEPQYDKRLLEFGDSCILIWDVNSFLTAIGDSAKSLGLEYEIKEVTYYNEDIIDGEISLFQKSHEFSWQNEFRVLIRVKKGQSFKLPVSNLNKMSIMIPSIELTETRFKATQ